jgi:RecA-family ATPase
MDATPELHDLPTTDQPTIPSAASEAPEQNSGADFFERNTELGVEIIEGTIREGQLVVFGGPYSVGKTPFLADLATHVLNGRKWHGRGVQQRPVIVFDFESSGAKYKQDIKNIASRLGVDVPRGPVTASHHVE